VRINVAKIRKAFGASEVFEFRELLEGMDAEDAAVKITRPVEVRVKVTNVGNSLLLEGKICAEVKLSCSRCLEVFTLQVEPEFSEEVCHAADEQAYLADHPEAAKEEDYTLLTSDELELAPLVGEQVVLNIPMKPLCSEACQGLCPKCGLNLNEQKCNCDLEPVDPRLAGLAEFFKRDQ